MSPSFSPEKRRNQTGPERAAKIKPDFNQCVCTWYYFVVSVMYVTAAQVPFKSESHTEVRDGGYAAIGTQRGLHVGQSAVTPTGLVYDLTISHLWRHVYFSLFFVFRLWNSEIWKWLWEECSSVSETSWIPIETSLSQYFHFHWIKFNTL